MYAADKTECIPIVTYVFVSKLGKILKYEKLANKEDGLTEAGSYATLPNLLNFKCQDFFF